MMLKLSIINCVDVRRDALDGAYPVHYRIKNPAQSGGLPA